MRFSIKFMEDMNEILGPQSWGVYFCEKSVEVCREVYGDSESSYYGALNFVKTHPSVPESERSGWIKTVTMLQSNIHAIKYGNRYEYLPEYKAIGIGYSEDFSDFTSAKNALIERKEDYYSTDFNGSYFSFAQLLETPDGNSIKPLNNLNMLEDTAKIVVHSIKGTNNIVTKAELKNYLEQEILLAKQEDANFWYIQQKIKDIDDGFTVFETTFTS